MAKNVVIRPSVREQYQKFMARGRVLFFTAPCGFGKSILAETLLAGQQVLSLTAREPDFALPADDKDWQVLLIDDLRQMTEEPDPQALCQFIREYSDRRFVLLSRGAVPGWLMAFQYAGLMAVLDADALLFDREDIRSLFRQQGTPVSESELSEILRETSGYPLGVAVIAHCMAGGRPYGPELIAQGYHEVFFYFDAAVYRRFDLPIRRFLLELAPFESFDAELARMVSGDPHAGEHLAWLQHNTTLLVPVPAALVSCGTLEKPNALTIAWTGITCSDPPMTYISVRPERYSYDIIKESGEFVINLTSGAMARATDFCGVRSGREMDKLAATGLTVEPAKEIAAPVIAQSPLALECRVKQIIPLGSHDMFLAEIVAVDVEERLLDETGKLHLEKAGLMAYSHGEYFAMGKKIGSFGYSVRKKRPKNPTGKRKE